MASLLNLFNSGIERRSALFQFLPSPHHSHHKYKSHFFFLKPHSVNLNTKPRHPWSLPLQVKANLEDIDMEKTKDGTYAPKPKKVVVLWDLDNKPPRGPPYDAAMALKSMAQKFGDVIDFSAYANRHAFIHLPQWVVEERRQKRQIDFLERKGAMISEDPYICSVCGRKCKTNMDLKKHFRQLHERERQKKLNRMKALKGKKRRRFKERFIDGNEKYNEAARKLLTPKIGYGLAQELRRAGVFVKTVQDKPQAADWALKRQMMHSMSRGVDWIVLVSDDSDFSEMLRKAREANLGTVVVGDRGRALGRNADIWVGWDKVENGEVKDSDLELESKEFSVSEFDGEEFVLDDMVNGLEFNGLRISAFSQEEEEEYEEEDGNVQNSSVDGDEDDEDGDYYFTDREDEEFQEEENDDIYS
ncbi:hypothetical protein ACJIZ3_002560 [Penstemon smallii]|uniref:C2H2-type domain-containing protein n=1 Tax=Penstemon smallii TaxID=265156 RepID=A0ABD3U7W9_9LAMI